MRHVLLLDLKDEAEAIAAYRHWHRPGGPPVAITQAIRGGGVAELDIWQVGNRLVMIMETTLDHDPVANAARDAADPEVQAWETLMDTFQQRLPFASQGQKWLPAEQIYSLGDQP